MKSFACLVGALTMTSISFAQTRVEVEAEPRQPQRDNATAQEQRSNQSQRSSPSQSQQAGNQEMNQMFAAKVALGNQEEIALSRFAMERAQHPRVKEFAQQMIDEHTRYLKELAAFAPPSAMQELQASASGSRSGQRSGQRDGANDRSNQSGQQSPNQTTAGQPAQGGNRNARTDSAVGVAANSSTTDRQIAICREQKQRCLDLTIENMQSGDTNEFDKAFVGTQVSMHIGMVAELETFSRHADGELKQVFAKGAQSAQQHLDHAKSLMKDLAQKSNQEKSQQQAN